MSEAKEAKSKKKEAKEPRRAEQEVEAPEAADPLDALVLAAPEDLPPNPQQILRLQRKVGNCVVSRLLDRCAAAGLGGSRAKGRRRGKTRGPTTPAPAQAKIQLTPDRPGEPQEGTTEVAGMPPGVHDERTAIYYAQVRRQLARIWSVPELIRQAEQLNGFLWGACERLGEQAQSEVARTLIAFEHEMSRRLQEAELGPDNLPVVEGVRWNPEDPLAGTTEAIPPFGMLDAWSTFLTEAPRPERRRRRTRPGAPVARIAWGPMRISVGDPVFLSASSSHDPGGNVPLRYFWELVRRPERSRAELSDPNVVNPHFTADREGEYALRLTVTNSRNVSTQDIARLRTVSAAEEQPTPDINEVLRGLHRRAAEGTFARWYLDPRNYEYLIHVNPPRVIEGSLRGRGRTMPGPFHWPWPSSDEPDLRRLYQQEIPITQAVEDANPYLRYAREGLQLVINHWASAFRHARTGGESGCGFMDYPEYQRFRSVMLRNPPRMDIPDYMTGSVCGFP